MPSRRVAIIANKWWEADPLCSVLIHDRARPRSIRGLECLNYPAARVSRPESDAPRPPDPPVRPRLRFTLGEDSIEVWCIEELMNAAEHPSSSMEKARVLQGIFAPPEPVALVVAFGTAGSRPGVDANGSVVIGRCTFIHDPRATAPDRGGLWTPPQADVLIDSAFPPQGLVRLDEQARYAAEARMLRAPVRTAEPPLVVIGNGLAALGVVNITNYDDYTWADAAGIKAFAAAGTNAQIGSVETTHGVIRSASEAPFLFVSGIADVVGTFDFEVAPRVYGQNFVAAHNAAIALAWLLPSMLGA